MKTETRFWKRKRVSVSRFHGDPFTYVVREPGNGNVFSFPFSMVIHLLTLLESQETKTYFSFLYLRVCLWSIVVNSANIDPAKTRWANLPVAGRFAHGQKKGFR